MRYIITTLLLIASIYTQAQISYWANPRPYTPPGTCKQYLMIRYATGIIDTSFEYTNCETGVKETGYLMDADAGGPTSMVICSTTTPIRYSSVSPPVPIDGVIGMEERGNCGDPIDPGESSWPLRIEVTASRKAAGGPGYGDGHITYLRIKSNSSGKESTFRIYPNQYFLAYNLLVPYSWGTVSIGVVMGGYNFWYGRWAELSIDNPLTFINEVWAPESSSPTYKVLTNNVTFSNSDYSVTNRSYRLRIYL